MARAKLVRARGNFAAAVDGVEHFVHQGDVLSASHPLAKARPELFDAETPVEQATAAPGEKRKR